MDPNQAELQYREQRFNARQHSYELTQKLSYFVISAELVFCGYILLNADKLIDIKGVNYLFITCGLAAVFGILWRFFYNETYHNDAHGVKHSRYLLAGKLQTSCYRVYIAMTAVTFVWAMVSGFNYLTTIHKISKAVDSKATSATTEAVPPVAAQLSTAPSRKLESSTPPSQGAKQDTNQR